MRKVLALLLAASTATIGLAQSPLTTLFAGNNSGNVGGGLYFDLTVNTTITITQIDINSQSAAGIVGSFDVYLGPTTYVGNTANIALWSLVTSAPITTAGAQVPTLGVLSSPFALGPGNYGVALKSNGHNWHYTNGVTCTSSSIPGSCSNSLYSNAELTLKAGAAQNAFLTGGVFQPRIFNGSIHYTPGGTPIAVASQQKYGNGCYGFYTSYHEDHPNPTSFDLGAVANLPSGVNTIKHTFGGQIYAVSDFTASRAFTPPSGTATVLALTSGTSTVMATAALGGPLPFPILVPLGNSVYIADDLEICTDGYITPTNATQPHTNPADATPTVAEFYNGAPRWCPHWKNDDPIAAGNMTIELEAATGALVVSWNAVASGAIGTPSSYQVAFFNNGDVEYRYGAMSQNGGGSFPIVMGWTQGGGALQRRLDVSAALPFNTDPIDNTPLGLELDSRPVLGTAPNVLVNGYTPTTGIGFLILSFTQFNPGLPLAPLGMPGCFQYLGLDDTRLFISIPPATSTSFPLIPGGIPNAAFYNGQLVFGQAATLTSGFNGLGVIASNGLRMFLGSL